MVGKLYKSIYLWVLVSSTSISTIAHTACTPKPDCDAIGYTETSCETDYLACPFDNTKLKCMPCDSTYRYNCVGENITKGMGDTCNGKYTSCECIAGAKFENGSCVCDTSCTVGNIYYSDKTCNSCVIDGKKIIGVVVKDNELVMSSEYSSAKWCANIVSVNMPSYSTEEDAKADYNGKSNTQGIVDTYGTDVDTSLHAAVYCYNFSTEGTNIGDWYLPAAGELYEAINLNYSRIKRAYTQQITAFDFNGAWSSSYDGGWNAWVIRPNGGASGLATRTVGFYKVYCFLSIG